MQRIFPCHASKEQIMKDLSDNELVERATGGNAIAFENLVNRHYNLVYRAAYKWCGVKEDAEDITQEVFAKLGRAIYNFKGDALFKTWLYRIVVNSAKDFHRKVSTKSNVESAYLEEMNLRNVAGHNDNPVSASQLYIVLNKLPGKLKDTLLLVLAEGLTHKEAAFALDCAETTVSWRIFQAKRKLQKLLKDEMRQDYG